MFSWITGNADMHLKNFSMYSQRNGEYELTPAYDMLSTSIVMPEDTEELALALNGKKRKIKKEDFVFSMTSTGVTEKVVNNMLNKFKRLKNKWFEFVDSSFLNDNQKELYKSIINNRLNRL